MSHHIVVGGGINGLVAALRLAQKGRRVVLVEKEKSCGGLLRCFDYGPHFGRFDRGMHTMYETGVGELDTLLLGLLPLEDWQLLEGPQRDLAGTFSRGTLHHGTVYPDLRDHPDRAHFVDGLLRRAGQPMTETTDAAARCAEHLGAPIAEGVMNPIVEKLFGHPAHQMAPMALDLTSLHRVALFDEAAQRELMENPFLRGRLAYPEQRHLPARFASGRRSFYPRKYGIDQVIDALVARCVSLGVSIRTSARIQSVGRQEGRLSEVQIADDTGTHTLHTAALYWTAALPGLAATLDVSFQDLPYDPPRKTVAVNVLLEHPPAMGDLHYFYCHEPWLSTLRVTQFGAYCPGAHRPGGHPLCVEMLVPPSRTDPQALAEQALDELRHFGLLKGEPAFARAEVLPTGFPMPTRRNVDALGTITQRIAGLGLTNVHSLGVLARPGLFFQSHILAHTWEALDDC